MARLRRNLPAIITSQKPDGPSEVLSKEDKSTICQILMGYRQEAEYARLSGPNSRDQAWLQNWDLYWNRYDYSKKAPWQSRELLPEFPQYIDRFAAAMRMALASVERFFMVQADGDDDGDLARVIRKLMIAVLRRIGRSPTGHPVDFMTTFEEAMKMGALSMCAAVVTSKSDGKGGNYTAVDLEDPYNIWVDPTGRGLYRIRRVEMDLHEFLALGDQYDDNGIPLYDKSEVNDCYASVILLMQAERQKRTGTGQWNMSNRRPITLHEYYCTIVDQEGKELGRNVLCVVANDKYLVRGPEENPFWHGRDWLVAAPIITVPLAPYGKSYAENFAQITKTFNELTNLILDAIQTSAMKVFAIAPESLEDPSQVEEGVYPNALFRIHAGERPQDVLASVDMGQMGPEVISVWQTIKKELQEGAAFNEMTLGQAAPKGRTSATEVGTVEQNSTSYLRSIASNIERLWMEPLLDLVWHTTIQHLDKNDEELRHAVGDQWFETLYKMRKEFAKHKISFVCRGISGLLQRRQKLQEFLQILQTMLANEASAQAFLSKYPMEKIVNYILEMSDIEVEKISPSPREQMMQEMMAANQQQQQAYQEQQMQAAGASQNGPAAPPPMKPTDDPRVAMALEEHKTQVKEASAIKTHQAKRMIDLQYEMAKPKPPPRPVQQGGQGGPQGAPPR